jgi:hypothetical protein
LENKIEMKDLWPSCIKKYDDHVLQNNNSEFKYDEYEKKENEAKDDKEDKSDSSPKKYSVLDVR